MSPAGWDILLRISSCVVALWSTFKVTEKGRETFSLAVCPCGSPTCCFRGPPSSRLPPSWPSEPAHESSRILTSGHFSFHTKWIMRDTTRSSVWWEVPCFKATRSEAMSSSGLSSGLGQRQVTCLCDPVPAFLTAHQRVRQPQL